MNILNLQSNLEDLLHAMPQAFCLEEGSSICDHSHNRSQCEVIHWAGTFSSAVCHSLQESHCILWNALVLSEFWVLNCTADTGSTMLFLLIVYQEFSSVCSLHSWVPKLTPLFTVQCVMWFTDSVAHLCFLLFYSPPSPPPSSAVWGRKGSSEASYHTETIIRLIAAGHQTTMNCPI